MKGSAPNFEKTGSQTLVQRKLHPKARRAGAEHTKSSIAIAPVVARTESAKASAVSGKAVSAMRQRGAGRREGVRGTAASRVTGRGGCGLGTAGVTGDNRGRTTGRPPTCATGEAGVRIMSF